MAGDPPYPALCAPTVENDRLFITFSKVSAATGSRDGRAGNALPIDLACEARQEDVLFAAALDGGEHSGGRTADSARYLFVKLTLRRGRVFVKVRGTDPEVSLVRPWTVAAADAEQSVILPLRNPWVSIDFCAATDGALEIRDLELWLLGPDPRSASIQFLSKAIMTRHEGMASMALAGDPNVDIAGAFGRALALGEFHETLILADMLRDSWPEKQPLSEPTLELLQVARCTGKTFPQIPWTAKADRWRGGVDFPVGEVHALAGETAAGGLWPLELDVLVALDFARLQASLGILNVTCHWRRGWRTGLAVQPGFLRHVVAEFAARVRRAGRAEMAIDVDSTDAGLGFQINLPLANESIQWGANLSGDYGPDLTKFVELAVAPGCAVPEIDHGAPGLPAGAIRFFWPARSIEAPAADLEFTIEYQPVPSMDASRTFEHRGLCDRIDGDVPARSSTIGRPREFDLLESVRHLDGIPKPLNLAAKDRGHAYSYAGAPGRTLADWLEQGPDAPAIARVLSRLSDIVVELNAAGIVHRDLHAHNIIVDDDERVTLIDFGEAVRPNELGEEQARPFQYGDMGNAELDDRVHVGFGALMRHLGLADLYLRMIGEFHRAWDIGRRSHASSAGILSCYYAWRFGAETYQGERQWPMRWRQVRSAMQRVAATGKILELGCNLGLLASYAARDGWRALGVDHDPPIVEGAKIFGRAIGVDARFAALDLSRPKSFEEIGEDWDLVTALAVVSLVEQPGHLKEFLARRRNVLFEGHSGIGAARAYLGELGFEHIELIGYNERFRALLLARK